MALSPERMTEKDFGKVLTALVKFYNTRPDEYGLMERSQSVYEEYAKYISGYVNDKNSTILDYGSGSWRIPETIAKYGFKKVIGLDYFSDEKMREYTAQIKVPNAELATYKNDKIPFTDNSFDAVSTLCVIEHLVYVEQALNEIDRVTKPGGLIIIQCPNWSGINVYISGLLYLIKRKDRFWRLEHIMDAFGGIFRSLAWYFEVLFSKGKFIMVYPRMKGNDIDFERSDDDAVHLCQPLSFKKYFKSKGYKFIEYNRNGGTTAYSKTFNKLFPSLATTNVIVVKKPL